MTTNRDAATLARIDELLNYQRGEDQHESFRRVQETLQSTLTVCTFLYGPGSPHESEIVKSADGARKSNWGVEVAFIKELLPALIGSLRAMKRDVETGLIGSVERGAMGEVIADMLGLAKEALAEGSDGANNVAAVLAAAAYEDTVRKMGSAFANVQGRPDLADVMIALKAAKVLVGAPFTTGQSYLKFRNDALHADWSNINPAVVGSCIAFVEGLILEHFA